MIKIEITETSTRIMEIETDSKELALYEIQKQYDNEEIVLDSNDFTSVTISLSDDDEHVVALLNTKSFCEFVSNSVSDMMAESGINELVRFGFGDWESAIDKFNEEEDDSTRICSITGERITSGYIYNEGEAYFKNEEVALPFLLNEGYASIDEACKAEVLYWTEWS